MQSQSQDSLDVCTPTVDPVDDPSPLAPRAWLDLPEMGRPAFMRCAERGSMGNRGQTEGPGKQEAAAGPTFPTAPSPTTTHLIVCIVAMLLSSREREERLRRRR